MQWVHWGIKILELIDFCLVKTANLSEWSRLFAIRINENSCSIYNYRQKTITWKPTWTLKKKTVLCLEFKTIASDRHFVVNHWKSRTSVWTMLGVLRWITFKADGSITVRIDSLYKSSYFIDRDIWFQFSHYAQ